MTTKLITSKQKSQIVRFVEAGAANAAWEALESFKQLTSKDAQSLLTKGGNFQGHIRPYIIEAIGKFSTNKHPSAIQLEKYFQEVFELKVDLSYTQFPEKFGFATFMAVPPTLDEDQIMKALTIKFGVNPYMYMAAEKINREAEQKRPEGLYVFAHVGGDEPDAQHLGKSYDDAIASGMLFLNAKEYLLVSGFHRWLKGHFMDKKGWTRTSSLWSDGFLVRGRWFEALRSLYLSDGYRGYCRPEDGPRELFLG